MADFVPITEIPSTVDQPDAAITWDFALPPTVDAERIELNVSKIERIHKFGYFMSSHITSYQGDITQTTHGFSGINSDGTAIASRAISVTQAEKQKTSVNDEYPSDDKLMKEHGRTRAVINLNRPELAERVRDLKKTDGVSSETAWAHELNSSLNEGTREVSRSHLLNRASRTDRLLDYFVHCNLVPLALSGSRGGMIMVSFLVGIKILHVGLDSKLNMRDYDDHLMSERRWSLFSGSAHQADIYLALNGLSRLGKTIRVAK